MSTRTQLNIEMRLLSDTIFGSGHSIPGGADIAVNQDDRGYPFLKGTTFKGLLRESFTNLLVWSGGDEADITALFGAEGWNGESAERRIHVGSLTLKHPPEDVAECYDQRTFTALEDGTVKEGSLRTAECIRGGLSFTGVIECHCDDVPMMQDALAGIKWLGSLRNRGFGQVQLQGQVVNGENQCAPVPPTRYIHYRLETKLPLFLTHLGRSLDNHYETHTCISGSTIRGMVMSHLAQQEPAWFETNKAALLMEGTRFYDARPNPTQYPALPAIKGFYEDKMATKFENVVKDGAFTAGFKRAKIGSFCAIDGKNLHYWSPKTQGVTRINRDVTADDKQVFSNRALSSGQVFEGYIYVEDESLAPMIASAFTPTLWLGADRHEGFGLCAVTTCEGVAEPNHYATYGCKTPEKECYLLALSPFADVDDSGNPSTLDLERLAQRLGVEEVKVSYCSTSVSEYGGYNRTWQSALPSVQMYDRGSLFHLVCSEAPTVERIKAVQEQGIGLRRSEGYGQILFLSKELVEGIQRKVAVETAQRDSAKDNTAQLRRDRCQWLMEQSEKIRIMRLSRSQFGTIQSLCQQGVAMGGKEDVVLGHLAHNLEERGAAHGARFEKIKDFMEGVLGETIPFATDTKTKLQLLSDLFDYARKAQVKEGGDTR